MGHLIRMLLSMLALAVSGVHTPAVPPACPPWCRMHGTSRTGARIHMRVISTVFDDDQPDPTLEVNLHQDDDGGDPYIRLFTDEETAVDMPLGVAESLGRALLSGVELAGGAR